MIAVRTDYFVLRNTVCPDFDARTAMTDWMRALLRALLLSVAAASVLLAQQSAPETLARRIVHTDPAAFRQSSRRARRRRQHGVRGAAQSGRRDAGVQLPASRRDPAGRRHRPPLPQRRRGDVRHSRRRSAVHHRRPHGHRQGTGRRRLPHRPFARHLQRRLDAGAVDEPQRLAHRRRVRRLRSRRHACGRRRSIPSRRS